MIFLVDQIVIDVMDIITTHSHVTYEQEGNCNCDIFIILISCASLLFYTMSDLVAIISKYFTNDSTWKKLKS